MKRKLIVVTLVACVIVFASLFYKQWQIIVAQPITAWTEDQTAEVWQATHVALHGLLR